MAEAATRSTTLFTFAELEFILRSVTAGTPGADVGPVRRRLDLPAGPDDDRVVASGIASLLARGLCRDEGGRVVPGDLVLAAVAALATRHTVTEAAGWLGDHPTLVHIISGSAARVILGPGSFGLFSAEVAAPDEPLSGPVVRFLDLCTRGEGEAALFVRSSRAADPEQDPDQAGVAVGRDAGGSWYLSDLAENPDQGRRVTRAEVVEHLVALFGTAVRV
jgi:hypothetical protein